MGAIAHSHPRARLHHGTHHRTHRRPHRPGTVAEFEPG
ncbi:hypothetical protein KCH_54190 [Kitasatospora cheerisanensis KCTC 2395]|uniref:Uncharacterized protein n=1 Tax=Kitasatospora cheerisanensis KCTC 2395 TaxID=1348663 RepID=A0A066YY22_9ACTN|nr:hypothetical protein KCH_54190 [Kitasatospora cheerisanensis KCTC 2395]